ncbi:MAG: acyltransferase, partial [Clostridia bacterium]|nr:acyltransferase [Clostridia bacterium]
KSYDLIDVFKLVGALLIFAMHMSAFGSFGENVQFYGLQLLSRWGVPFYFIISSFFLFGKSKNGNITGEQLCHYIKRIFYLYAVWFVINLPSIFYIRLWGADLTSVRTWLYFIRNSLISSTFTGSWYLMSCMFSSFLIYILSKKLSTKTILAITFLIHIFCALTSAYKGLFPSVTLFIYRHLFGMANSIVTGSFYFAIGKYIAENRERLSRIPTSRSVIMIVLFYMLYYIEIIVLKRLEILGTTDVAFALLPLAFFMAVLCINRSCSIKYTKLFRKISIIVYCSQSTVMLAASLVRKILGFEHSLIRFVIGCVIMAVCVCTVLFLQKKTKFKWVQYLT